MNDIPEIFRDLFNLADNNARRELLTAEAESKGRTVRTVNFPDYSPLGWDGARQTQIVRFA